MLKYCITTLNSLKSCYEASFGQIFYAGVFQIVQPKTLLDLKGSLSNPIADTGPIHLSVYSQTDLRLIKD